METEEVIMVITCPSETVEPLTVLSSEHDAEVQSSDRRNLDGEALTSLLVIISVGIKTAPAFLQALTKFLQRNQVERIECEGIVIEKPRPEDVEDLKSHMLRGRKRSSGRDS
jgi:hypothetical protein